MSLEGSGCQESIEFRLTMVRGSASPFWLAKGNKKKMQSQSGDMRENFLAAVEGMGL